MIDLFAGCGGLTSGFSATGRFEPIAAVEHDRDAAATYAQNFGDHIHVGDIADWVGGSMPAADVVVGGPPCQGFSALGKQDPGDPRNAMWRHYMSTLRRARPAFFVLENVPQFLKSDDFAHFEAETERGGLLAGLPTGILHSELGRLRSCPGTKAGGRDRPAARHGRARPASHNSPPRTQRRFPFMADCIGLHH